MEKDKKIRTFVEGTDLKDPQVLKFLNSLVDGILNFENKYNCKLEFLCDGKNILIHFDKENM